MSAAFPEINLHHTNVSPQLANAIRENLLYFSKLNKLMIEAIQKISAVQDEYANSLFSMVDIYGKKLAELTKSKARYDFQSDSFIKFFERLLEQFQNQGKTFQNLSKSFSDCVIKPMNTMLDQKKQVLKMCYHYVDSFHEQIHKKEEDLVKRFKDYSDAAVKSVKSSLMGDPSQSKKQIRIYHNAHNTYLLRLSSVNSMNKLLYTHVLPHVVYGLEYSQSQMNDSIRHHLKYMFSVQKESLKKVMKSVEKIDHATEKVDIVTDLRKFIKVTNKDKIHDKSPPLQGFLAPSSENKRTTVAAPNAEATFKLDNFTLPNLQRRLASLQHQTNQQVESISAIRSGENEEVRTAVRSEDATIQHINELLYICDKEANLNVLLKQTNLYTAQVINFLGPIPENILNESERSKDTSALPVHQNYASRNGQKPHEFIYPKVIKPTQCYYCGKLVSFIGKSFLCKICKMSVHKKCSTNVSFCEGVPVNHKDQIRSVAESEADSVNDLPVESSAVYDLIDFESDDDYYDDGEFDDGLSDDDEHTNSGINYSVTKESYNSLLGKDPPTSDTNYRLEQNSSSNYNNEIRNQVISQHSVDKSTRNPKISLKKSNSSNVPLKPVASKKPSVSAKPPMAKKPSISQKPSIAAKPPPLPARDDLKFCAALHDYQSTEPGYLSFMAGAKINIKEKSSSEWWLGELNGFEGYFPISYVKEISTNEKILRCLYDFSAEDENELNVYKNEILILVEELDEEWLKVKSPDDEGLVPVSYVEVL